MARYEAIRLPGSRLLVARALWVALVALALGLWAFTSVQFLRQPAPPAAEVTDPGVFTLEDVEILRQLGLPEALATSSVVFFLLLGAVNFVLGGWIFLRRSGEPVALLVSLALVLVGAMLFSYVYQVVNQSYPQLLLLTNTLTFLGVLAVVLLVYLFPDARFVPRWTRFLPIVVGLVLLLYFLPLPPAVKLGSWTFAMMGTLVTGAYARAQRHRSFSTPVQRQQTKWVGFGLLGLVAVLSVYAVWGAALPPERPSLTRVYAMLVLLPMAGALSTLLPITVAIAILRHRLWDVDIWVNRTVIYGPLTGILMGLYVGSSRLIQTLFVRFTGEQSDFTILLSTLVLAAVFWPLRVRLQALADRYFKEMPNPAQGLSNFGEQMRSLAQLADVGYTTRRLLDETVAAFHAESGAVFLQQGDSLNLVQTAGAWDGAPAVSVPLIHAATRLGELSLGPRHKGQGYSLQDRETLEATAAAAAQALALATRLR